MKKALIFGAAALGAAAMGRRAKRDEMNLWDQDTFDSLVKLAHRDISGRNPRRGLSTLSVLVGGEPPRIAGPLIEYTFAEWPQVAERHAAMPSGEIANKLFLYKQQGRRAGPRGYEVDDWGEEYVSSGFVGPLPRGDRRWKSSWDDDFRAGFAAGTKAKKIIPASTAYNRGKISKRHGSEWMVGYSAAIGVKRGLYATTPVRRAEALGLINQGRRAEKKPAIWGYINWTEGRAHPTRYSMPVYSAKQAYRTEDGFAHRHPSKKRVSISRKKPRNARPVPQHDAWE